MSFKVIKIVKLLSNGTQIAHLQETTSDGEVLLHPVPVVDGTGNSLIQKAYDIVTADGFVTAREDEDDRVPATIAAVEAERQRRIRVIVPSIDAELAYLRFVAEMNEKGVSKQTVTEKAKLARIKAGNEAIKALVAKADALIALPTIPVDYIDDKHWS